MVSISPGSSLGRYRIIEQLGQGGMATVFRSHDPNLDRYVAIKVLPSYMTEDPTFVARFTQEAKTVGRLNHPNILQIYDFGDDKGFTYLVSELVPGGTLQDKMRRNMMEPEEVVKYMEPLSLGLDYAHGQGIVHRDMKPANVLLDNDERPILADFGLARMLESSQRFTQASQAIGTPEYMSPEQAMGGETEHRADLYAFGVMIYEMLLGQTPFHADTPAATLMAHVHRPMPLPTTINPDIDPKLETMLLKSLAKTADDRYQSAGEMIDAIKFATGMAAPSAANTSAATAVMESTGLDTSDIETPTAVIGADDDAATMVSAPSPAAPAAPSAPAKAPAAPPSKMPFIVGGGVAAAVIVAIIAFVALSGGGDDATETGGAVVVVPTGVVPTVPAQQEPVATAVPTQPPAPTAIPTPVISLAEALTALNDVLDRVKETVPQIRQLTPSEDIEIEFKTREQLVSIQQKFLARKSLRDQIFEVQELYKALGLMDEDQDLEDIVTELSLQQVNALMDDETGVVYVLSDAQSIGRPRGAGICPGVHGRAAAGPV